MVPSRSTPGAGRLSVPSTWPAAKAVRNCEDLEKLSERTPTVVAPVGAPAIPGALPGDDDVEMLPMITPMAPPSTAFWYFCAKPPAQLPPRSTKAILPETLGMAMLRLLPSHPSCEPLEPVA